MNIFWRYKLVLRNNHPRQLNTNTEVITRKGEQIDYMTIFIYFFKQINVLK